VTPVLPDEQAGVWWHQRMGPSLFNKAIGNTRWMRWRYERFCQRYRHHSKGAPKCHWGSRMFKRLVSSARARSKKNKFSPGQQRLPWAWDVRLNQIPEDWHQLAVKFRKTNGIRDGDQTLKLW